MGIKFAFQKLGRIVGQKFNGALNACDDPIAQLNYDIDKGEETLKELIEKSAPIVGSEEDFARQVEKRELRVQGYKTRIVELRDAGDTDTAKKLILKYDAEVEQLEIVKASLEQIRKSSSQIREQIRHTREELEKKKMKRDTLVTRDNCADVLSTTIGISSESIDSSVDTTKAEEFVRNKESKARGLEIIHNDLDENSIDVPTEMELDERLKEF